jgi:hypothetical protein
METSASYEARSAPLPYPTVAEKVFLADRTDKAIIDNIQAVGTAHLAPEQGF